MKKDIINTRDAKGTGGQNTGSARDRMPHMVKDNQYKGGLRIQRERNQVQHEQKAGSSKEKEWEKGYWVEGLDKNPVLTEYERSLHYFANQEWATKKMYREMAEEAAKLHYKDDLRISEEIANMPKNIINMTSLRSLRLS